LNRLNRLICLIIFSNFFIAACALALTYESFSVLHLPYTVYWYLPAIFCSTLFIYTLHYYQKSFTEKIDNRLSWVRKNKSFCLSILVLSLGVILFLFIFNFRSIFYGTASNKLRILLLIVLTIFLSLGYSSKLFFPNKKSLRQIGWLKLPLLSFVWSFSTVALPALLAGSETDFYTNHFHMPVLFLHRFTFVMALCGLFNINDYEEDKKDGIETFAVTHGKAFSLRMGKWFFSLLNLATGLLLLKSFEWTHWLLYAAVLIPVLLIFLSYHTLKENTGKEFFTLKYDGLMLIKAGLLIFALQAIS
jgi:4-hydroxybenzoate polyprenyltransferase